MVSAGEWNLDNIFRRRSRFTFQIPKYQRGYDWEEEQIEDFWNDLVLTDENEDKTHFFGTIFTTPDNPKTGSIRIVDGQQRITTCALFLLCARDYFYNAADDNSQAKKFFEDIQSILYKWDDSKQIPDEKSFIVSLSRSNKSFFNQYITPKAKLGGKSNIKEYAPNDSCEKLSEAYQDILKVIDQKFGPSPEGLSGLNHMVYSLLDKFQMVHVTVDDEKSAYDMFNLINNRGTRLSESDLIKNRIFSQLDNEFDSYGDKEERLDDYDQKWSEIRDNITGEKNANYKLDNFFHHWLVAFEFKDLKLNDLYDKIHTLLQRKKPDEIIDQLLEWSKIFIKLRNPYNQFDGSSQLEYYLDKITKMNSIITYPVILAGYRNYWEKNDKKSFSKLVEVCFKFFIRSKTLGHISATPLEDKMHNVAYLIEKEKKSVNDVITKLIEDSKTYPTEELLDAILKELSVSNSNIAVYLLEEIERTYDKEKTSGPDVTIEHIMPRSITKWTEYLKEKHGYIGEKADEQVKLLHSKYKNWLGNLTLLSDPNNKRYSNKPFDEKKPKYADDGYKITQQLANEPEWTEDRIKSRQELFKDKLEEIFDLTQYLS